MFTGAAVSDISTYALGSAVSAQFYHYTKQDSDVSALMRNGNFKPINEWLKTHIHRYGASKKNLEVIRLATAKEFNPHYYINYLKEKFVEIYDLKK